MLSFGGHTRTGLGNCVCFALRIQDYLARDHTGVFNHLMGEYREVMDPDSSEHRENARLFFDGHIQIKT